MERGCKTDVALFIREHDDKIQRDLEKMVTYGVPIYSGRSTKDPKRNTVVFLNDMWVVIFDPDSATVITLFRIDLGVGDETNELFVQNAMQKIEKARGAYEDAVKTSQGNTLMYQEMIEHNDETIARYRKLIKELEQKTTACREMLQSINADVSIAEENLREAVETLIGRQHF